MNRTVALALAFATLSHATASGQTRITSVSTRTLQVEAGGAAGQLTVRGDGLELITSTRILQSGRAVDGLVARLPTSRRSLSTRDGGQLVVELEADASVRPGGDYQLELTAGRQQLLVPASISVVNPRAPKITSASPASIRFFRDPPSSLTFGLRPGEDERSHANNERTCSVPPHPAAEPDE